LNKREKALLSVAYGCGLRRSEIHNLNTNDVNLYKGTLIVRKGKGNKSRTIPLSDAVISHLKDHLIDERSDYFSSDAKESSQAFFIGVMGKRMRGEALNNNLKKIVTRTGNDELERKRITLHSLRHSIATHLIDKGADIEFVQRFLGHSMIDTAHLYAKRRKQKIMNQVF